MTEIAIKKYISDARFNKYSSYFVNLYGHNWLLNEAQFLQRDTLEKIFSNLPKQEVKFIDRKIISAQLNHIRKFRNRIFHFEKVINKEELRAEIERDVWEIKRGSL
jgi:hypothetical protein